MESKEPEPATMELACIGISPTTAADIQSLVDGKRQLEDQTAGGKSWKIAFTDIQPPIPELDAKNSMSVLTCFRAYRDELLKFSKIIQKGPRSVTLSKAGGFVTGVYDGFLIRIPKRDNNHTMFDKGFEIAENFWPKARVLTLEEVVPRQIQENDDGAIFHGVNQDLRDLWQSCETMAEMYEVPDFRETHRKEVKLVNDLPMDEQKAMRQLIYTRWHNKYATILWALTVDHLPGGDAEKTKLSGVLEAVLALAEETSDTAHLIRRMLRAMRGEPQRLEDLPVGFLVNLNQDPDIRAFHKQLLFEGMMCHLVQSYLHLGWTGRFWIVDTGDTKDEDYLDKYSSNEVRKAHYTKLFGEAFIPSLGVDAFVNPRVATDILAVHRETHERQMRAYFAPEVEEQHGIVRDLRNLRLKRKAAAKVAKAEGYNVLPRPMNTIESFAIPLIMGFTMGKYSA
jgi:hypothetical protein